MNTQEVIRKVKARFTKRHLTKLLDECKYLHLATKNFSLNIPECICILDVTCNSKSDKITFKVGFRQGVELFTYNFYLKLNYLTDSINFNGGSDTNLSWLKDDVDSFIIEHLFFYNNYWFEKRN